MTKPYLTHAMFASMIRPLGVEIDHFIQDANENLRPVGFEIRHVVSDYTDEEYYGICQLYEDSNASECLGLKAEVVQLFYRFLDTLIAGTSEQQSTVSIGEMLDKAENMSQSQAQESFIKLRDYGYVEINGDKIRAGPRTLLEFRPRFNQLATNGSSDIQTCSICLDYLLSGIKCSRCNCYMHRRCESQISAGNGKFKCPQCKCEDPYIEF